MLGCWLHNHRLVKPFSVHRMIGIVGVLAWAVDFRDQASVLWSWKDQKFAKQFCIELVVGLLYLFLVIDIASLTNFVIHKASTLIVIDLRP